MGPKIGGPKTLTASPWGNRARWGRGVPLATGIPKLVAQKLEARFVKVHLCLQEGGWGAAVINQCKEKPGDSDNIFIVP